MLPILAPLGRLALTAVASAGIVKALEDGRGPRVARRLAVNGAKAGIRTSRATETRVEKLRLGAGDIVAQAYHELGEQVPAPKAPTAGHDHQH